MTSPPTPPYTEAMVELMANAVAEATLAPAISGTRRHARLVLYALFRAGVTLSAGVSTAEGGGEADQSKGLKDPVWWLHRCNPEDPKLSWLSETPGEPRPETCPSCGAGSGWGWFEARPVGAA